jgi:hypothetical protein
MTDRMSAAEFRQMTSGTHARENKFGAVASVEDGRRIDSKAEKRFLAALRVRLRAGEIYALACQPEFPLIVNGEFIGKYTADFAFWDVTNDRFRVIDVKGVETREFKRAKKHVKALYGINVEVVR